LGKRAVRCYGHYERGKDRGGFHLYFTVDGIVGKRLTFNQLIGKSAEELAG